MHNLISCWDGQLAKTWGKPKKDGMSVEQSKVLSEHPCPCQGCQSLSPIGMGWPGLSRVRLWRMPRPPPGLSVNVDSVYRKYWLHLPGSRWPQPETAPPPEAPHCDELTSLLLCAAHSKCTEFMGRCWHFSVLTHSPPGLSFTVISSLRVMESCQGQSRTDGGKWPYC